MISGFYLFLIHCVIKKLNNFGIQIIEMNRKLIYRFEILNLYHC